MGCFTVHSMYMNFLLPPIRVLSRGEAEYDDAHTHAHTHTQYTSSYACADVYPQETIHILVFIFSMEHNVTLNKIYKVMLTVLCTYFVYEETSYELYIFVFIHTDPERDKLIWEDYKRNHKGAIPPMVSSVSMLVAPGLKQLFGCVSE